MFLGISFNDLFTDVYLNNKMSVLRASLFGAAMIISVIITFVRFGKELQQSATTEMTQVTFVQKIIKLLKPLLPFYLAAMMLPFAVSGVEYGINKVFNSAGISRVEKITDYDRDTKEMLLELYRRKEIIIKRMGEADLFSGLHYHMQKVEIDITIFSLKVVKRISTYLFGFAIGLYFLWLIGLEAFAPIAVLGLVFKNEMRGYFDKWLSHMIACKMYLLLLYVSNGLSIGFYWAFLKDDYHQIITGIIFLLFRVFLYRQSLNISSKIL